MYKFLDAGVRKVQHDLYITFIYSLNMSQSLLGYISPLSTKPFCKLSTNYRHFKTLAHKDRVTFISVLRGIEVRLLYLQVSEEDMAGVTDGLSNIFNFLLSQPKKYLEQMDKIAKASQFMARLGEESRVNPCILYDIDISGESPEKVLAVVNEYLALTDQLVAAFKRCNPASLEVEQNNPQAANAYYYNFDQFIYASWVVFLFLTIAGNCSAKDSLLNNCVPVFNGLLIILNLVLGIDFAMTSLRMIKNDRNQHEYLLMVLGSLSTIIVREYSWKNFHENPALQPHNRNELAEKIFFLVNGDSLDQVSTIVKDYLSEYEIVSNEFKAEDFVEQLEQASVSNGQMTLRSVYDTEMGVTHEALVAQVEVAVAALRNSKNNSAMLNQGWFGRTATSVAQGLTHRIGFANK